MKGQNAFSFLFGYDPVYWRGLRKHGLIDGHAGVRLVQCDGTPSVRCFNEFALPGGGLHREVWKQRRPLLIDRGCGGMSYYEYPFDPALMERYARRLGDRFLGVQFHEWVSNATTEWFWLRRAFGDNPLALRAIEERFDWSDMEHILQCGAPRHYANKRRPTSPEEMIAFCRDYQRRKLRDFHGYLTNVASYGIAHGSALRWGARVAMPEHGYHIPMGRVHTAAARGAVRQHGGSFGSYYAPWGNNPDSVTCYLDRTLWHTPTELFCGDAFKHRGNGGSSRAFQRRLFHWAYLTGVRFLAEEWGPENTFYDWKAFDLTPYGEIVRDFLRFVRRAGRGKPVVPAAVVIDREWFGLDTKLLAGQRTYFGFNEPPPHQEKVARFFRALVGHRDSPPNDDARVLTAGAMPDAFDIVADDASPELLSGYSVLCYVGERPERFRRAARRLPCEWSVLDDPERTAKDLTASVLHRMPVRVEGNVNWLVCRKPDGWQVGLFNPHGVTTDFEKGERTDPAAAVTARVLAPGCRRARASAKAPAESGVLRRQRDGFDVEIGPGGLLILEVQTA